MATVDLLVIGGGIHGACVARDAAMRGLSVVLVEKDDLASGTSSRSSKLIHGGLRYLETGQFKLVSEALRERRILLETAPGLVRRVRFMLPFYDGDARPAWLARLRLSLYDFLGRVFLGRSVLKRRFGGRHGGLGRRGRRLAERGSDENAPRVAASAEAAVGAEMAVAVENRQAGKFDG